MMVYLTFLLVHKNMVNVELVLLTMKKMLATVYEIAQ